MATSQDPSVQPRPSRPDRPDRLAVVDARGTGDAHGTGGLRARPVDPATLDAVQTGSSIDLGQHYTEALSPDGSTLAVMTWPGDSGSGGALRLIDVEKWRERSTDVRVDQHTSDLAFSPDGEAIYWTLPTVTHPAHGMGRDYALYRYAITNDTAEPIVTFHASFTPWEIRALPSGRVAVFGVPTDVRNISEGPPSVVIVDPAKGEVTSEVALDGVSAGQRERPHGEQRYEMLWPGLAWDDARELLYVAHADEDRITAVDLAAGRLSAQSDIHGGGSPLEHVLRWMVPSARAKMVPGTTRRAVLSPDGEQLYIVSVREEMVRESDELRFRVLPLGGSVVRTDDLREEARIDLPVSEVAVSPDGTRLILAGAEHDSTAGVGGSSQGSGLYVLDARTLDEIARLEPGREFSIYGFALSGRQAYAGAWVNDDNQLRVLDMGSLSFAVTRSFGESYADVLLVD